MRPPEVYRAINAITAELAKAGLPKQNFNLTDDYFYRSIDDVINRMSPLLASHGLCVLPRALERSVSDIPKPGRLATGRVTLKVAFDLVSMEDGTHHTIETFGEALDDGDKATAKAMSAAYKTAMLQAFCIPCVGAEDADQAAETRAFVTAEPVQGWDQWSEDIIGIVKLCESEEALRRVEDTNKGYLKAVQREKRKLYRSIGEEFAKRRGALSSNGTLPDTSKPFKRVSGSPARALKERASEHA